MLEAQILHMFSPTFTYIAPSLYRICYGKFQLYVRLDTRKAIYPLICMFTHVQWNFKKFCVLELSLLSLLFYSKSMNSSCTIIGHFIHLEFGQLAEETWKSFLLNIPPIHHMLYACNSRKCQLRTICIAGNAKSNEVWLAWKRSCFSPKLASAPDCQMNLHMSEHEDKCPIPLHASCTQFVHFIKTVIRSILSSSDHRPNGLHENKHTQK